MNTQIPASAAPLISTKNAGIEDARRSVKFHSSVWGDYFLAYNSHLTDVLTHEEKEHQRLKEEVKKLLEAVPDDSLHKLDIIDAIQRLGVGHYFETEIEKSLRYIYDTCHESCGKQESNLHITALRFRLLRQQGHYVSCDIFNKFKDRQGKFDESLISNLQGLLSLYEAAQFRAFGEETLEEALKYTVTQLDSVVFHVSDSVSAQVREALEFPIHKTMTRLGARKFLSIYQEDETRNDKLLDFARLDFNLLQKMYQKELYEITRWWKALEFENKLPFARDRLVECYSWALGVYYEPQYSHGRKMLAKVVAMISVIDDIYDVYGTLDELTLLLDAIERWDPSLVDQLPSYMKYYYKALLDVYVEIEEELEKTGKSSLVHYVIEEKKRLVRAYFQEAKWEYSGYIPTLEEYMKVGKPSGTYILFSSVSLTAIAELVSKEAFEWVASDPLILQGSEIIGRLMNDLVGFGFEQEISAVGCYMNQNSGASKEEAFAEIQTQVTNAWKVLNQECLRPTAVPMAFLKQVIVNLARVSHIMYKDLDAYTHSAEKLKDIITLLLVQPVAIP
ncbi:beta-caryophyllene synthase-like isoform X2 [Olea europaea var. sylvestris]|uniref:beta-caryophyllene synthase-like isoform X2 n=1 Tax=Olea europaea var. sylvestris TaxID=158386 RepID=UPI000C1D6B8F|nr:beta-caryophyllene synthase-like isoform X2 [Olea europaea var. sylvestris]